jgi:molecular chaperone GrpE
VPENDPARPGAAGDPREDLDASQDVAAQGSAADSPPEESTAAEAAGEWSREAAPEMLRAELEQAKDRALRSQAELENYRKRVARQMDEERRYANLPLIRDLLHVWDGMGRALEAGDLASQNDGLLQGFQMVVGQMEEVLNRHHCTRIEALGKPFDPHRHEAILQQPSKEHPPGTVIQETRAGFQLYDRVVRPSQVIVSAPPVPQEKPSPQGAESSQPEQEQS